MNSTAQFSQERYSILIINMEDVKKIEKEVRTSAPKTFIFQQLIIHFQKDEPSFISWFKIEALINK